MRVLVVLDAYTRTCLMAYAAPHITAKRVLDILHWLCSIHGVPQHVRSDNGPEFVAQRIQHWLTTQGSQTLYITPGSPWENPFIERFIGTLKAECLNRYMFDGVAEAQMILDHFVADYNCRRPHSALGYLTPMEYRQQHRDRQTLTSIGT